MHGITTTDPEQFTQLVNRYQLPLLRMCTMQLRDTELAKDAVQETLIKAYRAWPSFRNESSVQTWLMRIAINTCRDMQRSWWHRHVQCGRLPEILTEAREVSEDSVMVAHAIAQLPPKLREAVLLYYYQNMPMEEVAQALGLSLSSVSGRLKRARAKLRTALKGVYFDE